MIPVRLEIRAHHCSMVYFSSSFLWPQRQFCSLTIAAMQFPKTAGTSANPSGLELWNLSLLTMENQLSLPVPPWQNGSPWFSGRALWLPGSQPGFAHDFHSLVTQCCVCDWVIGAGVGGCGVVPILKSHGVGETSGKWHQAIDSESS